MYKREKPISMKSSTSAICNNLSVQVNLAKHAINYAVVHRSVVNLVSASMDGHHVNMRQVVSKEPSGGMSMIQQCKLVNLTPTRTYLVIASQKGITIFDAESAAMMFWYSVQDAQDVQEYSSIPKGVDQKSVPCSFGRGICGALTDLICVGTHMGTILVFNIPAKGTNITLSEVLNTHHAGICDMDTDMDKNFVVSSDDVGDIVLWKAGDRFEQIRRIKGFSWPCSSLRIWNSKIVAGYGSGHIRVFCATNGQMTAEVTAHGKWINAIDVARTTGMVLSVGEDSFVRVWQLVTGPTPSITSVHSEHIPDNQLQGCGFIHPEGNAFGVTGYDNNDIVFFNRKN